MKQILYYLIAIVFLAACSFPHDNPVDPENTGIQAPNKVTNLDARGYSTPKRIELNWQKVSRSSGYIVYRAGYADGDFRAIKVLVEGEFDTDNPSYTDSDDDLVPGTLYYYRVSAFIIIDDDLKLEGDLSDDDYARIPANKSGT